MCAFQSSPETFIDTNISTVFAQLQQNPCNIARIIDPRMRTSLELQPQMLEHQLDVRIGNLVEVTEMFANVDPAMEVVRNIDLQMSTLLLQEPVDVPGAVRGDAERSFGHHLFQPLIEPPQHDGKRRCRVHLQLSDTGELLAEIGEYRTVGRPTVHVELRDDLVCFGAQQDGRELDDLVEVTRWIGGFTCRLEVDHNEVINMTNFDGSLHIVLSQVL